MTQTDNTSHPALMRVCGLLLLAAILITACGSGGRGVLPPLPPPPQIYSVSASCSPGCMARYEPSTCTATVSGAGNFDSSVTWSVTNGNVVVKGPDVGQFIQTGYYQGNPSAYATITATSNQDRAKFHTVNLQIWTNTTVPGSSFCSPSYGN